MSEANDVDPQVIETIESTDGLKEALQVVGRAGMQAQENGKCVLSFEMTSDGLTVLEVTDHVEELEGDSE